MDVESLRKEYEQRKAKYERLKDEIIFILEQELEVQQIPIHAITGRLKKFDSLLDKAQRQQSKEPFNTILDICGVRVICLFLSDLKQIGEIIEAKFNIHTKDDKVFTKPYEAFGYMSIHYIGVLPDACKGPRYDDLKELQFEIQLRTIAMHSWATISHYLDYKSPFAIPSNLRKDFSALSALFYLADNHFEFLFRSSQEAKEAAERKAKSLPEIGKEEINYNTLTAYLAMKYPRRKRSESQSISELVEELRAVGYTYIGQIDDQLQKSAEAFKKYEKDHPPVSKTGKRFQDVGVVRSSLRIADENYLKNSSVPEPFHEEYRKYRRFLK